MSSPLNSKFRQRNPDQTSELNNWFLSCCGDNNIEKDSSNDQSTNLFSPQKKMQLLEKSKPYSKQQIKLTKKHLSPNAKTTCNWKNKNQNEQANARAQIKSLELQKESTRELPSPRLKGDLANTKKLHKVSVKKSESALRGAADKKNEEPVIQNMMENCKKLTPFSTEISLAHVSGKGRKTEKFLDSEKKYQQNPLFSFRQPESPRHLNPNFPNQTMNISFANQNSIKTFSPPSRFFCKSEFQKNPLAQNSPQYEQFSSNFNAGNQQKTSPAFNQLGKTKIHEEDTARYKELFKTIKEGKGKAQIANNYMLTTASDDDSNKVTERARSTENLSSNHLEKKKPPLLELPNKTLNGYNQEFGVVKQSVISHLSEEKKELEPQSFLGANTKIVNANNVFTTLLNPQADSKMLVSYGTSYNPSILLQSYKPSHRFVLGNLSSATVNSIMEPIRESQVRQKVEQSVVMLDFFNAPPQQRQFH